jgi:hypothetical protein
MRISLKEYFSFIWRWLLLWVVDGVGLVQDYLFDIPILKRVPREVWWITFIAFLLLGNFRVFHKIRLARDELRDKLDTKQGIGKVLEKLAKLRERGVALRHEGKDVPSDVTDPWVKKADSWRKEVFRELKKVSRSEAIVFNTLDLFPMLAFDGGVRIEIHHQMSMLAAETSNLRKVIQRWQEFIA